MALVLIKDDYTDSVSAGTQYRMHTPVALGDDRIVLLTNIDDTGTQARVYTLTDGGWTRGNAVDLPWTHIMSRACAVTADGHVLIQAEGDLRVPTYGLSYYVLAVNGTSITVPTSAYTPGYLTASNPDGMVRLPGTNTFFAWRFDPWGGSLFVDAVRVTGTSTTIVANTTIMGITDPPDPGPGFVNPFALGPAQNTQITIDHCDEASYPTWHVNALGARSSMAAIRYCQDGAASVVGGADVTRVGQSGGGEPDQDFCHYRGGTAYISFVDTTTPTPVERSRWIPSGNSVEPTYRPHGFVGLDATSAIAAVGYASKIQLVHLSLSGSTLTAYTQDVTDYGPAPDVSLVPGYAHQGEMLVPSVSNPNQLVRVGVDWTGASFTLTTLPVSQLATGYDPTGYTPRTSGAGVALAAGACYAASGGYLYAVRQYFDDGSDDNWILVTQYNQSTGEIITNYWTKGAMNGGPDDVLYFNDLACRFDPNTSRLIVAGTEISVTGDDIATIKQVPRLATFRVGYDMAQNLRGANQAFER